MKKENQAKKDLSIRFEELCRKHSRTLFIVNLTVFSLLSMLLFNMRVSIGGDDSTYIIRAVNFINQGTYPSFQGPVYPLFLSVLVALFGVKLGLLKLSSFVLLFITLIFIYKTFKNRISYTVLHCTLTILSVSSYFIFFTSQTYSEALFMFLQIPVFFIVFNDIENQASLSWKRLVLISFFIVLGYLTRTVGIGTLIAVISFYLITKQNKKAGIIFISSVIIFMGFMALKSAIWDTSFFDNGQASTLIYKHPYDKTQGLETFQGFIHRFIDNSNLYLSKQFLKMTGLKSPDSLTTNSFVTLILYALFIFGLVKSFKDNKHITFTALYVAVMLGITFLVLQKLWDQYRLIIPFFPYMLIVLFYALLQLSKQLKNKILPVLFAALFAYATLSSAVISLKKVDVVTLQKNIQGDRLLGYTDDWVNYLSMAEYVDKNLNEDDYVAVRKPNMARLYANGRKFYGIYRFDTNDPDKLLQRLKDHNVTHIIMASLRKNPAVYNKQTINTIQRYMYNIVKKYPNVFEIKHLIGKQEPAYLFDIK